MFKRLLSSLHDQKGVIHLIPLLLILIGIVAGVYLVQHPQIFKPKASSNPVEWIKSENDSENCITSVDGNTATANCSKIKLKLNPEALQTSDAGFQLIKTAYANHPPDTEDWYCRNWPNYSAASNLKYSKSEVWHSEKYKAEDMDDWWEQGENNVAQTFGGGLHTRLKTCDVVKGEVCKTYSNWSEERGNFQDADCFPADKEPSSSVGSSTKPSVKPNAICYSQPKANENGDAKQDCFICFNNKIVVVKPNGKQYFQDPSEKSCTTGTTCQAIDPRNLISDVNCLPAKEEKKPLEELTLDQKTTMWFCKDNKIWRRYWVDATDLSKGTNDILNSNDDRDNCDIGGKKCEEFYNEDIPSGARWDARCVAKAAESGGSGAQEPGAGGQPGAVVTPPQAPAGATQPVGKPATNIQNPGVQLPAQAEKTPAQPAVPGTQTVKTCKNQTISWDQLDSELKGAKYVGPFDHTQQELEVYNRTACPAQSEQPKKESRKIVKYRLAVSSPLLLDNESWKGITSEPISLNLPGLTTGTQSIFVQFQDDKGKTVKINGLDWYTVYVKLTTSTIVPEKDQPANQDSAAKADCPVENYLSYSIEILRQKCSARQLSRLPVQTLKDFSNQDLLSIAKDLNGEDGPYIFLDQFDNDRLGSFDLGTLKKLPEGRINSLPENLKNLIKGTGSTSSDQAGCTSVSVSGNKVTVNFTGTAQSLKIWLASNSELGKAASAVGSWSQAKIVSDASPLSGSAYTIDLTGFAKGTHAVLVSLHGSAGQMLDGNNSGVNPNCAGIIDIQ